MKKGNKFMTIKDIAKKTGLPEKIVINLMKSKNKKKNNKNGRA